MNQVEALSRVRDLGVRAFETRDVSALLRVSPANASVLLSRLAGRGLVRRVGRGRWTLGDASPGQLVEQLAAPAPAYVSLQSAMFRHGMIEQVPAVTFGVTLGRARRFATAAGAVSLHRIPPALFGGFVVADDGTKLATPEKALFDFLYLCPTKSRIFASLPEVDLGRSFRWSELRAWALKIAGKSRRAFVEKKLDAFMAARRRVGPSATRPSRGRT